jgi:outer membrane protein assembly factor BamD
MRLSRFIVPVVLLLASGCGLLPEQVDQTKDWSASQLHAAAKEAMGEKNYEKAIDYFEKLEARYPFGRYAQQAQLEIAYAYYKYEEPEAAIAAADRFIKVYPRHPNVDYAWYLKGLININRGKSLVDKFLPQDPSERDLSAMRDAYDDFHELTRRYPNSKYYLDAAQRMVHLRNNMAQYELHVADYYMRRSAFIAAANRAEYVIENYQRTPAVPEALVYMVQAYNRLGEKDLAADGLRVLEMNYPDHPDLQALREGRAPRRARSGIMSWFLGSPR